MSADHYCEEYDEDAATVTCGCGFVAGNQELTFAIDAFAEHVVSFSYAVAGTEDGSQP